MPKPLERARQEVNQRIQSIEIDNMNYQNLKGNNNNFFGPNQNNNKMNDSDFLDENLINNGVNV